MFFVPKLQFLLCMHDVPLVGRFQTFTAVLDIRFSAFVLKKRIMVGHFFPESDVLGAGSYFRVSGRSPYRTRDVRRVGSKFDVKQGVSRIGCIKTVLLKENIT